jgi:UDP-2,4-diacetamido-2,4,6-trideoxy-beta-L-altropyranose hydrolase
VHILTAAIRVDASSRIGMGHVMRCVALAERLRERGIAVRFICRRLEGHLEPLLRERGHDVAMLPAPQAATAAAADGDYAAWLGVPQGVDAEETAAALAGARPDWLVVDHYALDADWERAMRPHAGRTLAIDDLAGLPHACEALLDQNFSLEGERRHAATVPADCRLMIGPRHALLRPEFAQLRSGARERAGVRRIFVFFGGTDPGDMTGRTLDALSHGEFAGLELDLVVGANYRQRDALEARAKARPRTRLHGATSRVAELMRESDLAIGAGGITTWERMCLGLPTILVSIAENQAAACRDLATAGLARYLGSEAEASVEVLRDALRASIASPGALDAQAAEGQALVDGLGAARVAEVMFPTPTESLRLRRARAEDASNFFAWLNDPEVRRQSLNSGPVAWSQHRAWYSARLASAASRLFVLEAGDLPVGQVRFDHEGGESRVDYSIDPLFRGRGWAIPLIRLGMREAAGAWDGTVRAEVKEGNVASCAVFRKLGFEESRGAAGLRVFRNVRPAAVRSH